MDLFQNLGSFNKSDYFNFTGPPIESIYGAYFRIYINDNDPNYNWSKTAAENEWCSGSGTYLDPYVIEDIYVNANGTGGCIGIYYSKKYFNIRNCWLDYSDWIEYGNGVYIWSVENGTVTDNIITYTRTAVLTEINSNNITISNNIIVTNHTGKVGGKGICLTSNSYNFTILNNKILNHYQGMGIFDARDIKIEGNFVENTIRVNYSEIGHPIGIYDCNDSRLTRNVLAGHFARGSFNIKEENCEGNVIEHNTVSTNESLRYDFDIALSIGGDIPHLAQSTDVIISLKNCNYNYIGYNVLLVKEESEIISGYDPFLFIGLIGLISVAILVIRRVKR